MKSLIEHLNEYIGSGSVNEAFGSTDCPNVVKAKVEFIDEPKLSKNGNADCFTITDGQPCLPCIMAGAGKSYRGYALSKNGKAYLYFAKTEAGECVLYDGWVNIVQGKKKVLVNMSHDFWSKAFPKQPMVGCEATFTLTEDTEDYCMYEIEIEYPYWYDLQAFVRLYAKFVFNKNLEKSLKNLPFKMPYKSPYDIWCNYCLPVILMWKANGKIMDELVNKHRDNLPVDANEVTVTLYKMGINLDKNSAETVAQYLGSTVNLVNSYYGF